MKIFYTLLFLAFVLTTQAASYWTGAADSIFTNPANWNGGVPASNGIAYINTSTPHAATITSNVSVGTLSIDLNGSLHIFPNDTLTILDSLINFNIFTADTNSAVRFNYVTPVVYGNFIGSNSFASIIVENTVAVLFLSADLEIRQNLTLNASPGAGINMNGHYINLHGDFINNSPGMSTQNIGTLIFSGNKKQHFYNSNSAAAFTFMTINKSSDTLILDGPEGNMLIDSVLTLTKGIINTRANDSLLIFVRSAVPTAIVGGSTTSFIDGKLKRALSTPMALPYEMNFPVGGKAVGILMCYEAAKITFTTNTTIPNLTASFESWPALNPIVGPYASECSQNTYNMLPIFDHGYWHITRPSGSFAGKYNLEFRNLNYTNNLGSFWTIVCVKDTLDPALVTNQQLIGDCNPSSTNVITLRDNFNFPANANECFNMYYMIAQDINPALEITAPSDVEQILLCQFNQTNHSIECQFYPNTSMTLSGKIRLHDITGKILQTLSVNSPTPITIPCSNFAEGIYIVEFISDGIRVYKKVIVE